MGKPTPDGAAQPHEWRTPGGPTTPQVHLYPHRDHLGYRETPQPWILRRDINDLLQGAPAESEVDLHRSDEQFPV